MENYKCKNCGESIRKVEAFHNGKDIYCGDCAIETIVKIHGISKDRAYHHLEQIQFGNGYRW